MNKTVQARRRKVARDLKRIAGYIRRLKLTDNEIKIVRPEDTELLEHVADLAAFVEQHATDLLTPQPLRRLRAQGSISVDGNHHTAPVQTDLSRPLAA